MRRLASTTGPTLRAQLEAEARYHAELEEATEAAARDLDPEWDAKLIAFRAEVQASNDDECTF